MRIRFVALLPVLLPLLVGVASEAFADPVGAARQSGYALMSPQTQAMQDDPGLNPATFWLLDGQTLWQDKVGPKNMSCADCHGDAQASMKGVAARYPKMVEGTLSNLDGRINLCRTAQQQLPAFPYESKPLLSISTYIGAQSRGMPIVVEQDHGLQEPLEAGRAAFYQRIGQLNLSCAQCHAERSGEKLAGNPIPQGHPTGYPIYRLEWQSVGSLERRLRNCLTGVRAEPYAFGAKELLELELFLNWRAQGMLMETPGVRP